MIIFKLLAWLHLAAGIGNFIQNEESIREVCEHVCVCAIPRYLHVNDGS